MPMSNDGLNKLIEESGELQQVLGKWLAYPDHIDKCHHPDGGKPLLERFVEEAGDVIAAINFVAQKKAINPTWINRRASEKLKLFEKWDEE